MELHSVNESVEACVGECSTSLYVYRSGGTGGVGVVAEVGVVSCYVFAIVDEEMSQWGGD